MTLRRKTLATAVALIVGFMLVQYLVTRGVLMSRFRDVEEADVLERMTHIRWTLVDELTRLTAVASDWASGGAVVPGGGYTGERRSPLASLGVSFALRLGEQGTVTWMRRPQGPLAEGGGAEPEWAAFASGGSGWLEGGGGPPAAGLALAPGGVALLACRAVAGEQQGEGNRSLLIVGRYLGSLSALSGGGGSPVSVSCEQLHGHRLEQELLAVGRRAWEGGYALVQPLSRWFIVGYALLDGMGGRPGLVLSVSVPRSIYEQGRASVNYFLCTLLGVGLGFLGVMLLFLEKQVLVRVAHLSRRVVDIGSMADPSERVDVGGRDELTDLARAINEMLAALHGSREQLQEARDRLEERVEVRTRELANANDALVRSEQKLKSIIENIGIGIALISREFQVLEANRQMSEWFPALAETGGGMACSEAFGFPQSEGRCTGCPTTEVFEDGKVHEAAVRWVGEEGAARAFRVLSSPILDDSGRVVMAIEMVEDVTERLAVQERLRQSQKMEAVGQLAGGIAHDFNNLLMVMMSCARFIRKALPADERVSRDLAVLMDAGDKGAVLTRQLLAFSRQQVLTPQALDLNSLIEGMGTMLERLIDENIALQFVLAPDLWEVRADRGQLELVVMNLVLNARDAMPDGGSLTLETANAPAGGGGCCGSPDVTDDQVLFTVTDTGGGMSAEVKARIFEPFFTTKEKGKGTGLGLSTAYGIIDQHGGAIAVETAVGQGAVFRICLPRVVVVADGGEGGGDLGAVGSGRDAGGTERILLVEDDPDVRELMGRTLRERGYVVVEAEGGEAALRQLAPSGNGVDLLLTDVIMPGMDGKTLADEAQRLVPGLRILFASGYAADRLAERGLRGDVPLLIKPFSDEALARKVREVLSRREQ